MPNFFKSFFSGKSETPESEKQKNDQKNFEIFKYDGLRAQRMGRPDYAVKCFTEALAIQEEFETMGYLSQLYIQMGETAKARELLEKMAAMEPHLTSTFLTLANVCFIQEDYQAMEEAANKAIAIEEGNAVAHYLLGKARKGQKRRPNDHCPSHQSDHFERRFHRSPPATCRSFAEPETV